MKGHENSRMGFKVSILFDDNEDNENNENNENNDTNAINYNGDDDDDNTYVPELSEKDIMDIDFNANKNDFFANHEYKGLKLKNKEDEIKVLKMLKKYADDIRNKMEEKDKLLSDHKKRIDDLEDENIKLLKKDLHKMKEEIKNKPYHTKPKSHREKNEDGTPTLHYY